MKYSILKNESENFVKENLLKILSQITNYERMKTEELEHIERNKTKNTKY